MKAQQHAQPQTRGEGIPCAQAPETLQNLNQVNPRGVEYFEIVFSSYDCWQVSKTFQ